MFNTVEDMKNESIFLEFKNVAALHGYDAKHQIKDALFFIKTKNKVKHEIKYIRKLKKVCIVTGHGRSDEDKDTLKEKILEMGYGLYQENISSYITCEFKDVDQYFSIAKNIENIDELVFLRETKGIFGVEATLYSPLKIAMRYEYAIKNKDVDLLSMSRQLLTADKYDNDISINKRTEERTYREHIVPCAMIHRSIIDLMLSGNYQINDIAGLIDRNLKIAYINKDDAYKLDYELGLKTTMPKNAKGDSWTFGNSVTARLDFAGVSY